MEMLDAAAEVEGIRSYLMGQADTKAPTVDSDKIMGMADEAARLTAVLDAVNNIAQFLTDRQNTAVPPGPRLAKEYRLAMKPDPSQLIAGPGV